VVQEYLPKLIKWINKKKFKCQVIKGEQGREELELEVEIFKYKLNKKNKTDFDKVREEMRNLKNDKLSIDREMKLFNFYFFT